MALHAILDARQEHVGTLLRASCVRMALQTLKRAMRRMVEHGMLEPHVGYTRRLDPGGSCVPLRPLVLVALAAGLIAREQEPLRPLDVLPEEEILRHACLGVNLLPRVSSCPDTSLPGNGRRRLSGGNRSGCLPAKCVA